LVILGINAYHANASAAIVVDGRLIAAVEEERFNRVRYAAGFPVHAVRYCLDVAGLRLQDVNHLAIPRDPSARLGTKLFYALRMPRFALDRARVIGRFASLEQELASSLGLAPESLRARAHRIEHHRAHLASAFFVSPYDRAAVISLDGFGDFSSAMWASGRGSNLHIHGSVSFPQSLGVYYTAITQYLGFWNFGDEYKVMGLAAYGQPTYLEAFRKILLSTSGVGFRLGLRYFLHHHSGADMTWSSADATPSIGKVFSPPLEKLLGPARAADEPLTQRHFDIAASLQARLEEVFLSQLNALNKLTGQASLCFAGGVAFNSLANGKIFSGTPFQNVFIQPAAGDAGLSVGAAFHVAHEILSAPRSFVMTHSAWGPEFSPAQMRAAIDSGLPANSGIQLSELPGDSLYSETARLLASGKILGWFQGRAEWGPRALGFRSILADPRRAEMKGILNSRIKHRESFRPFAPSILDQAAAEYFLDPHPSPFMTFALPVRPEMRSAIPAPTHVDGTARLQTVTLESNPAFWRLIRQFGTLTGVPVLLNTSFNDNEPIVCRPEEALDCFLRTKMDVLVLGNFLLLKPDAAEAAN
jgi:carbamoyltransferase